MCYPAFPGADSLGGLSNAHGGTPRARAKVSKFDKDTFQRDRSTPETYVLSRPHSSARASCDQPLPTLSNRRLKASTPRRSSGEGAWVGGLGLADMTPS